MVNQLRFPSLPPLLYLLFLLVRTLIVGAAVIVGLAAGYLIATRTSSAEKTVPVPPTSAAVPKPERSFSVNVKY